MVFTEQSIETDNKSSSLIIHTQPCLDQKEEMAAMFYVDACLAVKPLLFFYSPSDGAVFRLKLSADC